MIKIHRHLSFLNLWVGLSVSELAGALITFSFSILVYNQNHSVSSIGIMWLFYFVPSIIVQLISGPFLDRYSKKYILIIIQFIKALLLLCFLATYYISGHFIFIYIFQLILGCLTPIFTPVSQAILPNVSEEKYLPQYNSILDATSKLMIACGPIMSGVIISMFSPDISIIIAAILFFISAIGLLFIIEIRKINIAKGKWIDQLKEGFSYYFQQKDIVRLGNLILSVQFAVGVITVINLPYIIDVLSGNMKDYGVFMASFPVGYVVGASIVSFFSKFNDKKVMLLSLTIAGTTFLLLGINSLLFLAFTIEFISGIALAIFNSYNTSIVQKSINQEYSGRIFALRLVIIRTAIPLGVIFATIFSDILTIRGLYLTNTLLILIFILLFSLKSKHKTNY